MFGLARVVGRIPWEGQRAEGLVMGRPAGQVVSDGKASGTRG